ncbi:hypothetical protein TYRP_009136 [Tyrophagus putrescentiae]|nr:hypothetical protein TYRP_009136 [Tyrophagus putrescentiae]
MKIFATTQQHASESIFTQRSAGKLNASPFRASGIGWGSPSSPQLAALPGTGFARRQNFKQKCSPFATAPNEPQVLNGKLPRKFRSRSSLYNVGRALGTSSSGKGRPGGNHVIAELFVYRSAEKIGKEQVDDILAVGDALKGQTFAKKDSRTGENTISQWIGEGHPQLILADIGGVLQLGQVVIGHLFTVLNAELLQRLD